MRRYSGVAATTLFVICLSVAPAHAQGLWRWIETLSGPTIGGLGVEVTLLCPPAQPGGQPRISIGCSDVDQTTRHWFTLGAQVYILTGDNSLTDDPNDRVDVLGIMPFVTYHSIPGVTVSLGPAFRRYATPAGSIRKTPIDLWVGVRPGRLINRDAGRSALNRNDDFLEVRGGLMFHSGFDAGDFGPGTEALSSEVSPYFAVFLDFLAWQR